MSSSLILLAVLTFVACKTTETPAAAKPLEEAISLMAKALKAFLESLTGESTYTAEPTLP